MKMYKYIIAILMSGWMMAGSVENHIVIWYNLSTVNDSNRINDKVKKLVNQGYLDDRDAGCWSEDSLLFMRSKPKAISVEMIKAVVRERKKDVLKKVRQILRSPYPEAPDGFDGIIVYDDQPTPRLYSISRNSSVINVKVMHDVDDLEILLCSMMPEIVRRP